ncbi:VOC family protein [Nocardioides sp. YIM 152315]|uniref:VOC family protein n=1 Tax=Nocardioides sp. YIM 152315 TaxID=3031760 RepID=UPI0023DBC601|nr:VOC family protein [Nocardioides sp. YIM 152315]MDF1602647.1 VOC family protein [Nocardioides sp. YIM 152315]
MDVDLFAGLPVTDYARGVAWIERLLGRPSAFEAHETESVWELAEHCYLYVVLEPEHAGHAMVTVFLGDLDAFLADAAERGLDPDRTETYGNGVRKAIFRDADGNEIGFGGGGQ